MGSVNLIDNIGRAHNNTIMWKLNKDGFSLREFTRYQQILKEGGEGQLRDEIYGLSDKLDKLDSFSLLDSDDLGGLVCVINRNRPSDDFDEYYDSDDQESEEKDKDRVSWTYSSQVPISSIHKRHHRNIVSVVDLQPHRRAMMNTGSDRRRLAGHKPDFIVPRVPLMTQSLPNCLFSSGYQIPPDKLYRPCVYSKHAAVSLPRIGNPPEICLKRPSQLCDKGREDIHRIPSGKGQGFAREQRGRQARELGQGAGEPTEGKRWRILPSASPVRLYISHYHVPKERYVDGITDPSGRPLIPESRKHILHGMVYDRETRSIYPPPPPASKPRLKLSGFGRKAMLATKFLSTFQQHKRNVIRKDASVEGGQGSTSKGKVLPVKGGKKVKSLKSLKGNLAMVSALRKRSSINVSAKP